MTVNSDYSTLRALLRRRLELIADHRFRDLDAPAHLAALQQVSELIQTEHERLRPHLPAKLQHYLAQSSLSKALEYIEERTPLAATEE
jgi:hypothetical protein